MKLLEELCAVDETLIYGDGVFEVLPENGGFEGVDEVVDVEGENVGVVGVSLAVEVLNMLAEGDGMVEVLIEGGTLCVLVDDDVRWFDVRAEIEALVVADSVVDVLEEAGESDILVDGSVLVEALASGGGVVGVLLVDAD